MFSPALAYAQFAPDWLVAEGIHSVQWHVLGDPQSLTVVPLGEIGSLRLALQVPKGLTHISDHTDDKEPLHLALFLHII